MISPSVTVSINKLILILKILNLNVSTYVITTYRMSCDNVCRHRTRCYASDNVCPDLYNYLYSIYLAHSKSVKMYSGGHPFRTFGVRYINMLLLRLLIFYNKQFKRKCYYCFRGVCPSDKRSNGQSKYLY